MGYYFAGFFVNTVDHRLNEAVKARWPLVDARPINRPFVGYGFSFPDPSSALEIEDGDKAMDQSSTAEEELPQFSTHYPSVTFLWVEADCWPSLCHYTGFACRNGQILLNEDPPVGSAKENSGALRRLIRFLGVELGENAYFLPFERGFFRFQRGYYRL